MDAEDLRRRVHDFRSVVRRIRVQTPPAVGPPGAHRRRQRRGLPAARACAQLRRRVTSMRTAHKALTAAGRSRRGRLSARCRRGEDSDGAGAGDRDCALPRLVALDVARWSSREHAVSISTRGADVSLDGPHEVREPRKADCAQMSGRSADHRPAAQAARVQPAQWPSLPAAPTRAYPGGAPQPRRGDHRYAGRAGRPAPGGRVGTGGRPSSSLLSASGCSLAPTTLAP
jgi:hypothetical protein